MHALDEAEDFASISSALLVNMGTLSSEWVAAKKLAAKQVGWGGGGDRWGGQGGGSGSGDGGGPLGQDGGAGGPAQRALPVPSTAVVVPCSCCSCCSCCRLCPVASLTDIWQCGGDDAGCASAVVTCIKALLWCGRASMLQDGGRPNVPCSDFADCVATLTPCLATSGLLRADVQARSLGKPWVMDPVGCGATAYRTRACLDLMRCRPTVVRGNGSEILALAGAAGAVAGLKAGRWGVPARKGRARSCCHCQFRSGVGGCLS